VRPPPRTMTEQDTFEPHDDPYDVTSSEEDLPDETDAERHICLNCGNIMIYFYPATNDLLDEWVCPVCG